MVDCPTRIPYLALSAPDVFSFYLPLGGPSPAFPKFDTLSGHLKEAFSIAPRGPLELAAHHGAPAAHEPESLIFIAAFDFGGLGLFVFL